MSMNALAIYEQLSDQRKRILALAVEDSTEKYIADELGIDIKTVGYHKTILKKQLRVVGLAGLTRFAIKVRLIKP